MRCKQIPSLHLSRHELLYPFPVSIIAVLPDHVLLAVLHLKLLILHVVGEVAAVRIVYCVT